MKFGNIPKILITQFTLGLICTKGTELNSLAFLKDFRKILFVQRTQAHIQFSDPSETSGATHRKIVFAGKTPGYCWFHKFDTFLDIRVAHWNDDAWRIEFNNI